MYAARAGSRYHAVGNNSWNGLAKEQQNVDDTRTQQAGVKR